MKRPLAFVLCRKFPTTDPAPPRKLSREARRGLGGLIASFLDASVKMNCDRRQDFPSLLAMHVRVPASRLKPAGEGVTRGLGAHLDRLLDRPMRSLSRPQSRVIREPSQMDRCATTTHHAGTLPGAWATAEDASDNLGVTCNMTS